MISQEICFAILDSISHPIVFVDNNHMICYLNKPAEKRYYEDQGHSNLVGQSIFNCHNQKSKKQILNLYHRLQAGENEIFLMVNKDNEKITVVAVRDKNGNLLGYYERFEKTE